MALDKNKIIVTGCAGFIGYHTCLRLLKAGFEVLGIDNLNDYYDPALKKSRLDLLTLYQKFSFYNNDISDRKLISELLSKDKPFLLINLAAQAGVRYSLENPQAYIDSNISGFLSVLESIKNSSPETFLLFASSSSVYGNNQKIPYQEKDSINSPANIYSMTKISNELMAETYKSLYQIKSVGLRFFTVYGEYGRPDMAIYKFCDKIIKNRQIDVYNNGEMLRDFTYIDDIVDAMERLIEKYIKDPEYEFSKAYNLGNNKPTKLIKLIEIIEEKLTITADKNFMPMQKGEMLNTYADINLAKKDLNFSPKTEIEQGIEKFVDWYKWYYNLSGK